MALCKDGDNTEVTQINKFEYVELVARWKTTFSVAVSLDPFLQVHSAGVMRLVKDIINSILREVNSRAEISYPLLNTVQL